MPMQKESFKLFGAFLLGALAILALGHFFLPSITAASDTQDFNSTSERLVVPLHQLKANAFNDTATGDLIGVLSVLGNVSTTTNSDTSDPELQALSANIKTTARSEITALDEYSVAKATSGK